MAMRTCCCGCPIRTGALVIGYAYAIMSGVGALLCILAMFGLDEAAKIQPPQGELRQEEARITATTVNVIELVASKAMLLFAIVCVKSLLVSSLMIHGIKWAKPAYVLPWIIFFGAGMAFQGIVSFATLALALYVPGLAWLGGAALNLLIFCIEFYILVVVCSHYHRMKKSSLLDEEEIM